MLGKYVTAKTHIVYVMCILAFVDTRSHCHGCISYPFVSTFSNTVKTVTFYFVYLGDEGMVACTPHTTRDTPL